MDDLIVVVPFYNGHSTLGRLLDSIPSELPILVIDDLSDTPLRRNDFSRHNLTVIRSTKKGYFSGAVNVGLSLAQADVLIVNQDAYFTNVNWLDMIARNRERYGVIGEQPLGQRPAFPGYIHGSFMFIRQDVIKKVGLLNSELYPLWGATGEYQLRVCRAGFEVLPVASIPGFSHRPDKPGKYGSAMIDIIRYEPGCEAEFTRVPPEISVVIPCYNYGHYLPEAIDSLKAQSFQSFEVIIVNDASTDNSLEIAQSLADPWQGIKLIHLSNNVGTAGAVNVGIRQASGKYIARLDADDMMRPHRLGAMWELAEKNPHSFIFDDLILFGSQKGDIPGSMQIGDDTVYPLPPYDFERVIKKNGIHAGIFFPKQAWLDTGGYLNDFRDGRDDMAFNIALGIKGWCGLKIDKPGYLYRRDGQNRTLKNTKPTDYYYFKEQMVRHFPDIYRGVRPMGCCGSGISQITVSGGSQIATVAMNGNLPGKTGFEILEYIGASSADTTWWGPATKTRYVFGGSRRVGYVDARDAAGMLQMNDHGQAQFRVYVKPTTPELPVEVTIEGLQPALAVTETSTPKKRGVKRG